MGAKIRAIETVTTDDGSVFFSASLVWIGFVGQKPPLLPSPGQMLFSLAVATGWTPVMGREWPVMRTICMRQPLPGEEPNMPYGGFGLWEATEPGREQS